MNVLKAMPIGSQWSHTGWKWPRIVMTVIAHDEGRAIVRYADVTAGGTIYRGIDQHEFDTWVVKMYAPKMVLAAVG